MKKTLAILCGALLALAVACGGDDDGGTSDALEIFFAPDNADALAHAALPSAADLPGAGWEVSARDDFGEDDDDGFDFEAFAATEPACSQLSALASLGGVFGGGGDDLPAGRAQVEFQNARAGGFLPNSVEVEVEIEETVSEVEGAWSLVKDLLENDQTEACLIAIFNQVFSELSEGGDITVEVIPAEASSTAPNDGATLAFDLHMDLAGIELDMSLEMYLWPYGNAKVTTTFIGAPDAIVSGLTGPALDAVVDKLKAAAASGG